MQARILSTIRPQSEQQTTTQYPLQKLMLTLPEAEEHKGLVAVGSVGKLEASPFEQRPPMQVERRDSC